MTPANKSDMNIAEYLASVFEVSTQAMEYRQHPGNNDTGAMN